MQLRLRVYLVVDGDVAAAGARLAGRGEFTVDADEKYGLWADTPTALEDAPGKLGGLLVACERAGLTVRSFVAHCDPPEDGS